MAMTVVATIGMNATVKAGGTIDGALGEHKHALSISHAITNGNGADDKANVCQCKLGDEIAASATETLDLDGDTGFFGETLAFAAIKFIIFKNTSTDPGTVLEVGADVAAVPLFNAVDNAIKVPAGGFFAWGVNTDAGKITVTATTGDIISILNLDAVNAGQYQIILIGETA